MPSGHRSIEFFIVVLTTLVFTTLGFCMTDKDMLTLRKNGISPATIQLLTREKTIETGMMTIQGVVDLKHSGVNEKNLQEMIRGSAETSAGGPARYGTEAGKLKIRTPKDILTLKNAGVSDEVIVAALQDASENMNRDDREKAWTMLQKMGLIVDGREGRVPSQ